MYNRAYILLSNYSWACSLFLTVVPAFTISHRRGSWHCQREEDPASKQRAMWNWCPWEMKQHTNKKQNLVFKWSANECVN